MNSQTANILSPHYTEAVTILALLLYLAVTANVARARGKYGVKAPAVTGNEHFERAYRVQMNTLEQLAFFLPSLWLYAILMNDKGDRTIPLAEIGSENPLLTRSPRRRGRGSAEGR